MGRVFLIILSISFLSSCSKTTRNGIISEELPLTLADLSEIRIGETNHDKVLDEYVVYSSPKLELYVNSIAASIAEVSTRPHLPYKVFILDTEDVNIFGGPGGYMYITRGLFNFIDSESELAAVLAHEISHIANHEYDPIPGKSKMKNVYGLMLKGSEIAKDSIGTYGTAVNYGLKGIGKAAPLIHRRFTNDQEIVADEYAIKYLLQAGYDPRGLGEFVHKLSQVPMDDISRFVVYLNTHPPFQDRQKILAKNLAAIRFNDPKLEFKQDMLNEVRQMTVNAPDSILFQPEMGVHHLSASIDSPNLATDNKDKKVPTMRKPNAWF